MRCPKCGSEVADGSIFCPSCGNRFGMDVNNSNQMVNDSNTGFNMNNSFNNNMSNQNMNNNFDNNMSNQNMNNNFVNNIPNQNMNNNPNMMNGYNASYKNQSNSKVIIIIIVSIIAVIGLGVGIYFLTKPSSSGHEIIDYEKEYEKQKEKEAKELASNVSTSYIKLKDGNYLIIAENKANKDIMLDCTVEVYNGSSIVYTKEVFFNGYIASKSKGYAVLRRSFLEDIEHDKIVPKVTASYFPVKTYGDKITHTEEKKDNRLLITTVNNSGVNLDEITVSVLYYDENNNIIGFEDDSIYSNLTIGATNVAEVRYPTDENYNDITFSRYEIVITASGKYE